MCRVEEMFLDNWIKAVLTDRKVFVESGTLQSSSNRFYQHNTQYTQYIFQLNKYITYEPKKRKHSVPSRCPQLTLVSLLE